MKNLIIIFVCLFSLSIYAQDSQFNWEKDLNAARVTAQQQNKPVVMLFTDSNNCDTCKKVEAQLFKSSEFKQIADKAVLLFVDKSNMKGERLTIHYNKTNSKSALVAIDSTGKPLGETITNFDKSTLSSYITFLNTL